MAFQVDLAGQIVRGLQVGQVVLEGLDAVHRAVAERCRAPEDLSYLAGLISCEKVSKNSVYTVYIYGYRAA